jgi:iron complex transport system substrate-binding protein
MVCALGLGAQLVGISHECDYPPEIAHLPKLTRSTMRPIAQIGQTQAAAIEDAVQANTQAGQPLYEIDEAAFLALKPDLILTQMLCTVCAVSGEYVETVAARMPNKPQLMSMEPRSIEDVFADIVRLGTATGRGVAAGELITALRSRMELTAKRVADRPRPRTLVLEWTDPPYGAGHWTPALVEYAGGQPVAAFPGAYSERISWETAIAADPEVIIVTPCGFGLAEIENALRELEATGPWNTLRAGRRVFLLDGNQFSNRPGPRLIDTLEYYAAALHPETAAAVDASFMRAWPT